ncbi:hypothetical protein [Lacinutrix salivirga]
MKKIVLFLIILILVFIGLSYWSTSSTNKTFQKVEVVNFDTINTIDFKTLDSITITASSLYKADEVKRLMQGEQYRKAWSTPVKVPVLFLDTLFGGVKILKEGGGKQTHSLKLQAKNGIIYTLRSVNKNPKKLIPDFAKTVGLENIIVDGISAQHPYGSLLSKELSNYANILHTNPKLVFVPKQEKLGAFNTKYGNRIFMLEYETEGDVNWTNIKNVNQLVDTEDLQELKQKQPQNVFIDENALVRARLFDLLIGDWDRHTKQWGWALKTQNDSLIAIPIPGDRDNAFFNIEGVIPSLLSNKNVVPELRPFKDEIHFMAGLVYPFDRYFLLQTNEAIFIDEAEKLQSKLSDSIINEALKTWPKSIAAIDGQAIANKLKSRRDQLVVYAKEFNKILKEKGVVEEALKGSEDLVLNKALLNCFECTTLQNK